MSKIYDLFQKETTFKNESVKIRKVARYMLLISIVIALTELVLNMTAYSFAGIGFLATAFVLFLILFALSYTVESKRICGITMIVWIPWMFMQVYLFGWDIGCQLLMVLMVMIVFLCSYKKLMTKTITCFAIFFCYFMLYIFNLNVTATIKEAHLAELVLQIIITFCVMFGIGAMCYIFFNESQSEEGKLVQYNIKLENEANTDALTGLYNRRRCLEKLEKIYEEKDPEGFSVAMCDIDFFKKVNDNYGHDVGDAVLKGVAQVLKESMNEDVFASRWGGEEFLIVFNHSNGDQAFTQLYGILSKIRNYQFNIGDRSFSITMTMGLAEFDYSSDIDGMIKQADEKMYKGKESGRNQIVF